MVKAPVFDAAFSELSMSDSVRQEPSEGLSYTARRKWLGLRGMGVQTFTGIRKIEFLRRSMVHAAQRHGTFTHPEVVEISRGLDECIVAAQRAQGRKGELGPAAARSAR